MHTMARADRLLAYAIAGAAGFVDAAGFLSADRYFVSFMSGNTTRLGVELASGSKAALVALLLLAGFVVGVMLGAIFAERFERRRKSAVLTLSVSFLALAAVGQTFGSTAIFLGGAVLAMGIINNVFRRNGEVALGVTYMTGALVRMGEGLAGWIDGSGRGRRGAVPSMILWGSLSFGGLLGALAFLESDTGAPWLAVAWVAILVLGARRVESADLQSS
ncbi:YoaK family protein [Alteraurantiacibacter aquimixticola]|uniref:DUF1275 domain-containing protein n=1 Tax=Alteraurantiacibacter aquimixticola TaxID=2489173 RepID=A0A4T3EXH3_9SPHN|nr:YoaK family protein [Alteraurantiacibacter aquimixticola]TIX49168.1 DUF1275 domain-containing protein [Alteraurantiacibacter aquimixticola]